MAQSTFSIRMDDDTKRKFVAFCDEVGMTPSTAFTLFAKKVVREQRIPFTIGIEKSDESEEMNLETKEALEEVQKMKADPSFGKTYTDVDSMMKDLLA